MNPFREYIRITESKLITVYKGSNKDLSKIVPNMFNSKDSDEQKGVGMFFSTNIEDAKKQGSDIYALKINSVDFVDSEERISKLGNDTIKLLKDLHNIDHEHLYYLMSDYGFEVSDPENMTNADIEKLYNALKDEEIGTFQVDMVNMFGIEHFIDAWNKNIKFKGTFTKLVDGHIWYGILHISNIKKEK